jgi:tRNA (adenine22-N1)-methyltransferase
MRLFKLSPRLQKTADLVPDGARLWDVGSDHAKLPVWMLYSGRIDRAVVSDIRRGPLSAAKRTAEYAGVTDKIDFLLCDGLSGGSSSSADIITITGMGGETISTILSDCAWATETGRKFILQPMSSYEELRTYLYEGPWIITAEHQVTEGKRLYLILEVEGGGKPEDYTLLDTRIGKLLYDDPLFKHLAAVELRRLRAELFHHTKNGALGLQEAFDTLTEILRSRESE